METYSNGANAVLSIPDGETTDNLIASALKSLPKSAVGAVMPVVKTKGPTSQWVEPFYNKNKLELLSNPVTMYLESNERKHLTITSNAVEDLIRMYTPEAYVPMVASWMLYHKNIQQRDELVKVLQSPEVDGLPADSHIPEVANATQEDVYEFIQDKILQSMEAIKKDYQLGDVHFSVVGPYAVAYPVTRLAQTHKVHFMTDDRLKKIYVFPTGSSMMDRAGLGLFEYADETQKAVDPDSGDLSYWFYNRSTIVVNPCHKRLPLIRNITMG